MTPNSPPDLNDLHRQGTLPDDPFDGAVPMLSPAEQEQEKQLQELRDQRVGAFLLPALDRMRARGEGREQPIPLPWPSVSNALAGGLWPGLHVLVGNTGTGKSQLALQSALHAALAGVPVLYIGLELGQLDLVARLIGLLSGRKWSRIYLGRNGEGIASTTELDEIELRHGEALTKLKDLPFHLDVCPPMGWSYERLTERARMMRALYPETQDPQGRPIRGSRPFLVVLDFLQLVAGATGQREDLRERIGRAAYAGRAAARDHDAVVLLVSSTSRENYAALEGATTKGKAADGKPSQPKVPDPTDTPAHRLVGLGKESGEVEYAADSVLVLWRGESGGSDGFTTMQLAVAKARAGTPSWVRLEFNGGWFREPSEMTLGTVSVRRTSGDGP